MNAFVRRTNLILLSYMGITYEGAEMRLLDAMRYKVDPRGVDYDRRCGERIMIDDAGSGSAVYSPLRGL